MGARALGLRKCRHKIYFKNPNRKFPYWTTYDANGEQYTRLIYKCPDYNFGWVPGFRIWENPFIPYKSFKND